MKTISCKELKEKMDRGDEFKLVMTLEAWAYKAKHISGSINVSSQKEAMELLKPEDEIIVYCSNVACVSSQNAYHLLARQGYNNVRRFEGGLEAWEEAGFPLEGDSVE
jgi:rhodanese-related sulfurtransferase